MRVIVKRAYDPAGRGDGFRVLADRLWPRGVSKLSAKIDLWAKDVAPSNELRRWFHADKKDRLKEFSKRYDKELASGSSLKNLRSVLRGKGTVTIVTGVKDIDASHIPVLLRRIKSRSP